MDTSHVLAEHIAKTRYEDLPAAVVEVTKRSILDTLGVILAANTLGENGVQGIVSLVKKGGGARESTILGFGTKVVSWMAGFANGAMVHQLDYDDCHDVGVVHPGAATVPAAFAMAEREGTISGKEFITAIALGTDVVCRLSLPLIRDAFDYDFARTGTLGKYGATVAAGKLLNLDVAQLVSSFGLVLNQASISHESSHMGGSDTRAIRDGFGAQAGIFSALLAKHGVIGEQTSLDGKAGLYNLCFLGDSDPAKVTAELGKKFLGVEVSLKPWPCCRNIHGFVEAALRLKKEQGFRPEEIKEIIAVTGGVRRDYYEGLERRRRPQTSIDAKFSLPFVLGVALDRDDVLLEDFTAQGRENPGALALAQKVGYRFEEKYVREGIEIGTVEIVLTDGTKHLQEVPYAYGHPRNPIKKEDLHKKFRDCARYCRKPLAGKQAERVIASLEDLEKVKDMREVVKLLAG